MKRKISSKVFKMNYLETIFFLELLIGEPKCYCIVISSGGIKNAAKGIGTNFIKKDLIPDKFKDAILRKKGNFINWIIRTSFIDIFYMGCEAIILFILGFQFALYFLHNCF